MGALVLGWTDGETGVLLAGFAVAAYYDWKVREVSDRLWQLLALFGVMAGGFVLLPSGFGALGLWAAVGLLGLEQLFPWDRVVERIDDRLPGYLEIAGFGAVTGLLVLAAWSEGIGSPGVPLLVIAAFASLLLGRGLFEARLLYGGADAKALITAGLVLPVQASTWIGLPDSATRILAVYPFALTLLMNAALFAITIPVGLAIRNVRAGTFSLRRGFSGSEIPVTELPDRFVWLKDPTFRHEEEEAETTEEDHALRVRQSAELTARGVTRVWVTPQVPFLVLLFLGALAGAVVGNVIFDVLAYL